MQNIEIIAASNTDAQDVAKLVTKLLIELAPNSEQDIANMHLDKVAQSLIDSAKIWAFLAKSDGASIGVITLHECAAIYSGGVFGEISELYVKPEFRAFKVGEKLLEAAVSKAKARNWQRLEVGTPPPETSPRTINFYENRGFKCTGSRLRRLIE